VVARPEEDWVRADGTHEPLIEKELWDRVQSFTHKKYKPRRRSDGERNLFVGLLYCADCNYKMRAHVERGKKKDGSEYKYVSYLCGNYGRSGKVACTYHCIYENALSKLVIEHIQTHAHMIECSEDRIIEAILSAQSNETVSYRAAYQGELEANKKQIAKLDLLIESLYEDRVSGVVPKSLFKRQIQKYEQERVERLQTVESLETRIKAMKQNTDNAQTWTKLMKQYTKLETLDAETLLLLIDKILVGETQIIDGKRVRDIQIVYNYVGDVNRLGLESTTGININGGAFPICEGEAVMADEQQAI